MCQDRVEQIAAIAQELNVLDYCPHVSGPCYPVHYKLKIDHFDQMHVLPDDNRLDGSDNFRQVSGFPVFGTAQPTEEGFLCLLDKIPKGTPEKPIRTIWYNMRQEPVIYINGMPYAPRAPSKMHENLELSESVVELDNLQKHFANIIQARVDSDPGQSMLRSRKTASQTSRWCACRRWRNALPWRSASTSWWTP